jgi:hypothetical protein
MGHGMRKRSSDAVDEAKDRHQKAFGKDKNKANE